MMDYKLKQLADAVARQCTKGTWDVSPYEMGVANGLLLAQSIMTGREYVALRKPEAGWDTSPTAPA